MATLTTSPTLVAPKRQASISFALSNPDDADFIRVWCTVAPSGSELDKQINNANDPRNRYVVYEGNVNQPWNYTFDKGGKYTFVVQEFLLGGGYGGGYAGDPNGGTNEQLVGTESTLTIHVGQRATQLVGTPGDQSTLVLWVWNDTIQRTSAAFHGEDSPALVASSQTPRAQTALQSTAVKAAVAALAGQLVSTATGDTAALVAYLHGELNAHFASETWHFEADVANELLASWATAYGPLELPKFINVALKAMTQHHVNDTGAAVEITTDVYIFGVDTGSWHKVSGLKKSDRLNAPLYQSVASFADAYGALADLHRSLSAHMMNDTVHVSVNAALLPDALPPILAVHSAYLTVLASNTPAVPAAQSTGMQTLISAAGFTEG